MCKDKDDKGDDTMTPPVERYCTIEESIKESMKEVKAHREGKIKLGTWREFMQELEEEIKEYI